MDESERAAMLMRRRLAREQHVEGLQHREVVGPQHREVGGPQRREVETLRHTTQTKRSEEPTKQPKAVVTPQTDVKVESKAVETGSVGGINVTLGLMVGAVAASAVFVLPPGLKVFWVVMVGLVAIMGLGLLLFHEWAGSDNETYKGLASGVIYALSILYSMVVAALLLVLVWKIYSMTRTVETAPTLVAEARPKKRRHVFA